MNPFSQATTVDGFNTEPMMTAWNSNISSLGKQQTTTLLVFKLSAVDETPLGHSVFKLVLSGCASLGTCYSICHRLDGRFLTWWQFHVATLMDLGALNPESKSSRWVGTLFSCSLERTCWIWLTKDYQILLVDYCAGWYRPVCFVIITPVLAYEVSEDTVTYVKVCGYCSVERWFLAASSGCCYCCYSANCPSHSN